MKKKLILRCKLGILPGIAIGYLITIVLSLICGQGYYSPCMPQLAEAAGSESQAVLWQALLSGVLGAGFGAASVIWEIEGWSIVKQSGIYFGIISLIMMPIAYVLCWMEHSVGGFLTYFGIFALIFVIIWVVEFVIGKRTVKKMNAHLQETEGER